MSKTDIDWLPEGFKCEPLIERLKVVEIQDGDVLVLETGGVYSMESHQIIKDTIRSLFDEMGLKNSRAMLLEEGLHVAAILRRGE